MTVPAGPGAGSAARPVPRLYAYGLLMRAAVKSQLQYRGNLLFGLAGGAAFQGVGLAFIWVVATRFGAVGGWSMTEICLLYGMRLTSHGLWVVPGNQLYFLDVTIQTGEFDRYLVRPTGVLPQLLARGIHLPVFGDLVTGLVILTGAAWQLGVPHSAAGVLYLVLALVGGAMVEGAFQIGISAMCFRTLSNRSLRVLVDSVMNSFGGYPLKVFPGPARFVLTFLVPVAFVAYLPAGVLLGRAGDLHVPLWAACAAPGAGPLLLWLAHRLWRAQSAHYSSSGT
ncbi:ABC transporter permease [Kitasatospora purpeofusca]|uniref:ABC transporter permease n=1 Tax=Kitasatospora purpeofusca TaxID=67352 RepID=UPI0036D33CF2